MEGVLAVAKSLDTLGLFTHTPADMIALWNALGCPTGSDDNLRSEHLNLSRNASRRWQMHFVSQSRS